MARLWRWYVERLVCIHFCKFKQAGSDMKYTHVHILGNNPQGANGLGHDDHTNVTDRGHTTISVGNRCRIQAEDRNSMALRRGYLATAYFHQCKDGTKCPRGHRKIYCRCVFAENEEDTLCVCYTMDHEAWQAWYEAQKYPHRIGTYEVPYVLVGPGGHSVVPDTKKVDCGASLVLRGFALDRVPNCNGFGPSDADNRLIQQIRADLRRVSDGISCEAGCQKSVKEIWRGWECKKNGQWLATAVVQWKIECKKP